MGVYEKSLGGSGVTSAYADMVGSFSNTGKAKPLPQDQDLRAWGALSSGVYSILLTVNQNGLPAGWWYIEVLQHGDDFIFNQYRTMRATGLLANNSVYVTTDEGGVWTQWESIADIGMKWYIPTFVNGFLEFSTAHAIRYGKSSSGTVFIKGLVQGGTPTGNIFNLPAGMRTSSRIITAQAGNGGISRVDIEALGNVVLKGNQAGSVITSTWLSLYFSFKAEQ